MKRAAKRGPGRPSLGDDAMSEAMSIRFTNEGLADIEAEVELEPARPSTSYMVRVLVAEAIAARKAKRAKR